MADKDDARRAEKNADEQNETKDEKGAGKGTGDLKGLGQQGTAEPQEGVGETQGGGIEDAIGGGQSGQGGG
jgi:hypothetical protein